MENTKKLKMVRGSKEHPELVKKWLEEQGAKEMGDLFFSLSFPDTLYYYDGEDGEYGVHSIYENDYLLQYLDYEIVELEEPKPKPQHVFQPFEKVLVRDHEDEEWQCDFFSHAKDSSEGDQRVVCVCNRWYECIPYEGNEHLLGTTNSPKGGEE